MTYRANHPWRMSTKNSSSTFTNTTECGKHSAKFSFSSLLPLLLPCLGISLIIVRLSAIIL